MEKTTEEIQNLDNVSFPCHFCYHYLKEEKLQPMDPCLLLSCQ